MKSRFVILLWAFSLAFPLCAYPALERAANESAWFPLDLRPDLQEWLADREVPPEMREPDHRPGPLRIPNLLAYALGVDPFITDPQLLPRLQTTPVGEARVSILYSRNNDAKDVSLGFERSSDVSSWSPALPLEDKLIEMNESLERREAVWDIADENREFFRLRANQAP